MIVKLLRIAPLAPVCLVLAGCPSALTQYKYQSETNYDKDKNARVSYLSMTTKGDAEMNTDAGQVKAGSSSAEISADGTNASLKMPKDSVIANQDVARNHDWDPNEIYGDKGNSVQVEHTTGLNEENDTFLTYHENKSSPQVTELARGYAGTRSDASVIAGLRNQANHSATYNGTGSAYVGQGEYDYFVDGSLQMTAQFSGAKAGLVGQIMQTAAPDLSKNPNGVNQVTFTGKFIDGSSDYSIGDIKLNATGMASSGNPNGEVATITNGGGVGSFFGSHAQGTMGTFSGAGQTTDSGQSPVNVIGSFQGKTADNDP